MCHAQVQVHCGTVSDALMQARCEMFNGEELLNLEHLAGVCDSCTDVYMRFGLEGGKCLILERKQVLLVHANLGLMSCLIYQRAWDACHNALP